MFVYSIPNKTNADISLFVSNIIRKNFERIFGLLYLNNEYIKEKLCQSNKCKILPVNSMYNFIEIGT